VFGEQGNGVWHSTFGEQGSSVCIRVRRSAFRWKLAFDVRCSVAFGIREHRKRQRRSGW
uniref:Uncharacterized protein n=1 Tax=Cucumis melo TaxID=3656 RepID=A0A9I9E152_CUCME